jgi:hypothetical protein
VEEADEPAYWLELLRESILLRPERLAKNLKDADELVAMAVASHKAARGPGRIRGILVRCQSSNRPSAIVNSSS